MLSVEIDFFRCVFYTRSKKGCPLSFVRTHKKKREHHQSGLAWCRIKRDMQKTTDQRCSSLSLGGWTVEYRRHTTYLTTLGLLMNISLDRLAGSTREYTADNRVSVHLRTDTILTLRPPFLTPSRLMCASKCKNIVAWSVVRVCSVFFASRLCPFLTMKIICYR